MIISLLLVMLPSCLHALHCPKPQFVPLQNHNYAVDPESLPEGAKVTHINLNDNSCAGLQYPKMKLMSLQYHPESSPGPHDSDTGTSLF
jgi:carbamoyl-phosphate synthase small subunit